MSHHSLTPRQLLIKRIALLIGAALIGFAISAYWLGIDHNPSWGPRRFGILVVGIYLIIWGIWECIYPSLHSIAKDGWKLIQKIVPMRRFYARARIILRRVVSRAGYKKISYWKKRVLSSGIFSWVKEHQVSLAMILVAILSLSINLWIFSGGRMTSWLSNGKYYWRLANAFRHEQVHLLVEPSQELLNASNPYDIRERGEIPILWDASFYDGKYYLYWGPVPALFALLVYSIFSKILYDNILVFIFVTGTNFFTILLLGTIWRCYKKTVPVWVFFAGILATMVNAPWAWLLSRPLVYEVAIAGGQFFLLAGLYWAFSAFLESKPKPVHLMLAGVNWALAAGTRVTTIPVVVFASLMVLWQLYRSNRKDIKESFPQLFWFVTPLIIGAILLGWYNYARFDSILEFGHRYQLTGLAHPSDYSRVFSIDYVIPNLYTYLFRPPSISGEFPYIRIPWINDTMWPFFINLPKDYYYAEPVAGLLILLPLISLTFFVILRRFWLKLYRPCSVNNGYHIRFSQSLLTWLILTLFGSGLIQLFILLFFISSNLRYVVDLTLAWHVLATIFIGHYTARHFHQSNYHLLRSAWVIASLMTVMIALLVGANHFDDLNPVLYDELVSFFP
jgi:hypothetical protein